MRHTLNHGFAIILLLFMLIDGLLIPVLFLTNEIPSMVVAVIAVPFLMLMWWLNRRGTVYGAVLYTVWNSVAIVLASDPASYAGPTAPIPLLLIFPIVIAALFIRPQAALWTLVLLILVHALQLAVSNIPSEYAWRFLMVATLDLAAVSVVLVVGTSLFERALRTSIAANKALEQENRERLQAEQALRQSEHQARAILETSPVPLMITRLADGEIFYANAHVNPILGLTPETTPGWNFAEFYDDPEERKINIEQLLRNGILRNAELRGKRQDDTSFWILLSSERMIYQGQDAIITGFYDITERKRMEVELRLLNAELEQRVVQRTEALTRANEQLKELDILKSKFIADVSHELRTPVTNLGIHLYLAAKSPEAYNEHLPVLRNQVSRLTSLIHSVLDLSRLELTERKVAFGSVDLNALIRQEVTAHLPYQQSSGLRLAQHLEEPLLPVRGEVNQLGQVVTNLIGNAFRYTTSGDISVRTWLDRGRNMVGLEVVDSGIGIEPEDLKHLFERFYRGHNAAQSNIPGTGLGLSIVKEIVDLHQGQIEVESQLGHGSTFRVWLPIS